MTNTFILFLFCFDLFSTNFKIFSYILREKTKYHQMSQWSDMEKKLSSNIKLNMNVPNLLSCPNEVIERIIANLPARDLSALSKACHRLHEIVGKFSYRWKLKFGDKFLRIVRLFEEESDGVKDQEYIPWREHYQLLQELEAVCLQRQSTAKDDGNS
jgi:hypothetical protein